MYLSSEWKNEHVNEEIEKIKKTLQKCKEVNFNSFIFRDKRLSKKISQVKLLIPYSWLRDGSQEVPRPLSS